MAISGISSALFAPAAGQARRGQGAAATGDATASAPPGTPAAEKNLTSDQQSQLRELKKTDAEVRTHEQAHKTAGGPYAGSIQLEYTTGPDGRRYATAGEVPIDVSPVRGNPEATITKMEVVKRAALAPQNPSPQDRAVASQADATKAQAQTELRQSRSGDDQGGNAQGGRLLQVNALQVASNYQRAASVTQPGFNVAISA